MNQQVFDHPAPNLPGDWIFALAVERYDAVSIERLLPSERDQNILCARADGSLILIKIANAGESAASIDFQTALLIHANERAAGLALPRPVADRRGAFYSTVDAPSGARHFIRALDYLPGQTLARIGKDRTILRGLGRRLGLLSRALSGFDHPAAHRGDFLWNLDNAEQALGWREEIGDEAVRGFAGRFVTERLPALRAATAMLRRAVLYQDANDHNVIVTEGRPPRVSGFIDFGDAVHGTQVNELAVALAYAAMDSEDPLSACETVISGYCSVFPLEEGEADILLDLAILRLLQSVCISHHRAAEFGANADYLTISQKPALALLARLAALDPHQARNRTRLAAGFGPVAAPAAASRTEELRTRRSSRIAPSLSVAYREPLTIVQGEGCWLIDDTGRRHLDLVNNVAHVGHCHPHVVAAISRQAGLLNTNARYLHPLLLDYADRIVATLPEPLSVCIFVCSGSEANELAIRMARTWSGRTDAVVLGGSYHGHSSTLIDISPYKFARKGGQGKKDFVQVADMPEPYRGPHRGMTEETGAAYAASVAQAVEATRPRGGPAFFIAESYLGVGGQVILPPGFLRGAYQAVRAAGGLCIADEVQVGFGRPGQHMWAFEEQDVVPDIITLGKPIGAGHPMAAVVTTPEIAKAFANGMEYFNTFGGNPVSCAAGMAVLDVIEDEDLMGNALRVGEIIQSGLRTLAQRFDLIGDVRGRGLFIGADLVTDRATRAPAAKAASDIANALRHRGIFISTDGPFDNVLKIKPPMVLGEEEARFFLTELGEVLSQMT